MPDSMTLLLVEDSEQQRQKLTAILEFVAQSAVSVTSSQDAFGRLDEKFEAILLGDCGTPENLTLLFNAINEKPDAAPVLLLVSDSDDQSIDKDVVQGAFAMLNLPMRYAELSDVLQRAQIFNVGRTRGGGSGVNLDLFRSLVGNSRSVIEVRKLIEQELN